MQPRPSRLAPALEALSKSSSDWRQEIVGVVQGVMETFVASKAGPAQAAPVDTNGGTGSYSHGTGD